MARDFYPRREADILRWTSNFRAHIQAAPHTTPPQELGLTAERVAEYAVIQGQFGALYAAAHSPTERTPSVMQAKKGARIALERASRSLAGTINAQPGMTPTMRSMLGLALRGRGGYRRALPPPGQSPRVSVRWANDQFATLVLVDREGDKRRKPRGAWGAVVRSFVGELPPADLDAWAYAGQTTRTLTRVAFDARLAPGTRVWLTASWRSRMGKEARPCEPVMTHVGYGGPMMHSPRSARMLYVPQVATRPAQGMAISPALSSALNLAKAA